MTKKVLLTGGSGDVGFPTFQKLLQSESYDVRLLLLPNDSRNKKFKNLKAKLDICYGDLKNPVDVSKAVEGVDFIVHLGALIPPVADRFPELAEEINVGGTRNIIQAAEASERKPKLVYSSSVSIYGDRIQNPMISVGDPLKPSLGDEYAKTKIQAEELVRNSELEWTIFRFPAVAVHTRKMDPLMFHMPLDTPIEFCTANDTANALVKALESDQIWGQVFNLGGGESCRISYRDYMWRMFNIFGLNPNVIDERWFAKVNFHCGYYADGDQLEALLNFREETLEDHFEDTMKVVPRTQRLITKVVPTALLKKYFERMSEPYLAVKNKDEESLKRFYGSWEDYHSISSP